VPRRRRPGAPHDHAGLLGIEHDTLVATERAPLEAIAERADLCVTYGEPSTAVFRFLDAGSFVLNVNQQQWPSDYLFTPSLFGDRTLPVLDHTHGLELVVALAEDPAAFARTLAAQQQAFRQRMVAVGERIFAPAATRPG
jgi:hypothetical protein